MNPEFGKNYIERIVKLYFLIKPISSKKDRTG